MAKPIKIDDSGDYQDLQSLFDGIAAESEVSTGANQGQGSAVDASGDSEELQSLFDSIAAGGEVPMQATKALQRSDDASGDSEDLQELFDNIAAGSRVPAYMNKAQEPGTGSSGDTEDLRSLFENIIAGGNVPTQATRTPEPRTDASGDSEDLQALFDSVTAQLDESPAVAPAGSVKQAGTKELTAVFSSLGQLTRELHDNLRDIGQDNALEDAARALPDARQRLSHIVRTTEQAASRALSAVEIAKPIQDVMRAKSEALANRWGEVFANQLSVVDFKALAIDTQAFLHEVPKQTHATNEQLTEILMAQDFQDLTGQVIKKVVDLVEDLETQLLRVLFEAMPPEMKVEPPNGLLNGPVVNTDGRVDGLANQAQVDKLLESLGF